MNTLKKEIKVRLGFDPCWEYDTVSIEKIREDLVKIELMGGTHIEFDILHDSLQIVPFKIRLETDEEYNNRITEYNDIIEQRELAELKRLQEKYNK